MHSNLAAIDAVVARSSPRTNLFLSATILFDGGSVPVRLRNLSESGARIEGPRLPGVETAARIVRGSLTASGTIVWRDARGCGLRFDQSCRLDEWMPKRFSRDQVLVDEMIDEVRSCSEHDVDCIAPRGPAPSVGALPARLAEELAYVARLLESLGDDLSGEPLVIARHAAKLQNIDISVQILGHLAKVIAADRPERAIDAIGMDSLRKRLQRTAL